MVRSRMVRDPANMAPTMGEVEEYAEGNSPVKVKESPVGPEILYKAFPVAKSKVEVWLHMGLGIMSTGCSYELFWEFLDMKNGEGNGTPLQHSCLENPMDGGAWWATVHGVAKNRTRLSNFTFTFHFHS